MGQPISFLAQLKELLQRVFVRGLSAPSFSLLGLPGCPNPFSYKPTIVIFISSTHHALRDFCKDLCSHQPAQSTRKSGTSKKLLRCPSSLLPSEWALFSGRTGWRQRHAAPALTMALTWRMWEQIKEKLVLLWVPAQTWFCAAALTERCFLSWQPCNYSTVLNNWVDTLAPLLPKELSLCCPLSVSTREKGRKNIFTSLSLNRRAP